MILLKGIVDIFLVRLYGKLEKKYSNDPFLEIRFTYCVGVVYDNIKKLVIMLLLMYMFDTAFISLLVLIVFNIVRSKSRGLHASNSKICLVTSAFLFIVIPKFIVGIELNPLVIVVSFIGMMTLLKTYAPADTEKNPIVGKQYRQKLCLEACIRILICALICLVSPKYYQVYYLYGAMISVILVLPMTYKILKKRRNNYERYECIIN